MSIRALCIAALLTAAQTAWAATPAEQKALDKAAEYEAQGQFDQAVKVLEPFAGSMDPEVEITLVSALLNNASIGRKPEEVDANGVEQALAAANRALAKGSVKAFNLLYIIHSEGYGIPVDYEKAADYLRRGAEAGESGALINYAVSLYEGSAVIKRDVESACPLIMQALKDENVQGLIAHQAGLVRIRGECGFKADPESGMVMVEMAAKRGVRGAERDMGMLYDQGLGVESDPDEALEWFEKAALHGDGYSQWQMGMAHVKGEAREKDSSKAVEYFRQSAESGNANGMNSLAVMYASGDGVVQDYAKAMALYEQSGEAGNPHAYRGLAVMYLTGEGVEVDAVRANEMYRKAVELGDPEDPQLEEALRVTLEELGLSRQ